MKKFIKQLIFGLITFILVNAVIAVIYEYPTYKSVQNKTNRNFLKWDAIHENKNTFDLVIIGTSRTYASFNPTLIDSALHTNSYNMATSAQDIAETYYSLQEIFEYQKPKYIVLDLFFQTADDSYDYYQTFSNASFFNSPKRKLDLIYDGYGTAGLLNYGIPVVKFKNYIKQDLTGLFSDNKSLRREDTWIKGYLYDTLTVSGSDISKFDAISNYENTNFDKKRFDTYFTKINNLVKSNNAQLICVRTPYPPTRFKLTEIDDEGNYFKTYTEKAHVTYVDLNDFETENYSYKDQDFADYHHPNYKGAKKASMQLIDIIKEIN